ncbi:trimethylguanosine synthase-like [Phalaenopsis equestris]|uniref:trimethylguanosine synthase-like n=1 Tax=Phalaenopsis equestris TaxID=78828 RepID=UPI0009E3271A|nr:trimethylguanosine synthase-like [Phalaenopsis equestris]
MNTIVDGEPSPMVLKSKKRKRAVRKTTSSAGIAPCLFKYWLQRYSLFSMFDAGISMDDEAWFSVTPEAIAASHAAHAAFSSAAVVIDCFAGVGGNAIQFAARGFRVVAVEIDPRKVDYAVKNARIYGVKDRIEFLVGDFFSLAPFLKDQVIASAFSSKPILWFPIIALGTMENLTYDHAFKNETKAADLIVNRSFNHVSPSSEQFLYRTEIKLARNNN